MGIVHVKVCGAETNVVDLTAGCALRVKQNGRKRWLLCNENSMRLCWKVTRRRLLLLWMKSQRIKKNGECA